LKYSEWIRRHRRDVGIPLVVIALIIARYSPRFLLPASVLILVGVFIRIWAAGHLRKEQVLTTGGPYRFIRNPLYLGSFFIAIGFTLLTASIWIFLLVLIYFLFCYIPVIRFEEGILREKFPEEFNQYSATVPAFYPSVLAYVGSTQFSWQQTMRNREYSAVLGVVVFFCYIVFVTPHF
jgi:protein-S-isoprenylcysteine O-methyltransferase Ste14